MWEEVYFVELKEDLEERFGIKLKLEFVSRNKKRFFRPEERYVLSLINAFLQAYANFLEMSLELRIRKARRVFEPKDSEYKRCETHEEFAELFAKNHKAKHGN